MRRHWLAFAALAAVVAVPAPAAPGYARPGPSALSWGPCPPAQSGALRDPRQRCTTLHVPLDYRNPRGRTIDIAVSRIATAKPKLRRGVLLSNPGGPGGQGIDLPSVLAAIAPPEVHDRYDLIGFDPRGVGFSTPVTCGIPRDTPLDLIARYPAPDGSIARNVAFSRTTAATCAARSGDLLPYVTTANTARDMDGIRAALGERKISYLGYSYGTYLGAVYTSLFPERSDRIVLDSAIDPRLVWYNQWRTWGPATAIRFPDFTRWAAARDATYHLGATSRQVSGTYFRLAAELDRDPLRMPTGLIITGNLFRAVTRGYLYSDLLFPDLAAGWRYVDTRGRTRPPATFSPLPAPPNVPADNTVAARYAVVCGEAAFPRDLDVYARNVAIDRRLFPVTNGMPSNLWPCVFWRYRPMEPPVAVTGRGPRDVLILQNLRDPATPWFSGLGLRRALDGRAVMVSVNAGGHGVYNGWARGSCAVKLANLFLAHGQLPTRDTYCPGPVAAAKAPTALGRPFVPAAPFGG